MTEDSICQIWIKFLEILIFFTFSPCVQETLCLWISLSGNWIDALTDLDPLLTVPLPRSRCFHRAQQRSGSLHTHLANETWQKTFHTVTVYDTHMRTRPVTSQEVLSHSGMCEDSSVLVLANNPVCWNSGPLRLHIRPPPHSQCVGDQYFTSHVISDGNSCIWWLTFSGQLLSALRRCNPADSRRRDLLLGRKICAKDIVAQRWKLLRIFSATDNWFSGATGRLNFIGSFSMLQQAEVIPGIWKK